MLVETLRMDIDDAALAVGVFLEADHLGLAASVSPG